MNQHADRTLEVPSAEVARPVPPHVWIWRRIVRYAPGILVLAGVGYLALLSSYVLSGLGYVPMAILLGAFISNAFGIHPALEKGISTYELWLKAGIVLLGSQVAFTSLGLFWLKAIPLAAATVLVALLVVMALGRLLRLPFNLAALLAAGTGICGVSAIIHTAPAIGADDEEVEYAVGSILVLGAAAILVYPVLGVALGLSQGAYGVWTGLSVNNTAEAVATGYSYGAAAGGIAIASKLCRVLMLGAVVAGMAAWTRRRAGAGTKVQLRQAVGILPKFVILFFAFSVLAGTGFISAVDQESLRNISSWLFLLAFAGIGFKLRWQDIRKSGVRPLLAVGVASLILSALTLGVSYLLSGLVL